MLTFLVTIRNEWERTESERNGSFNLEDWAHLEEIPIYKNVTFVFDQNTNVYNNGSEGG